jgi:HAD superfamily hydrolase (TIGR01549 family)
VPEAAIFDIDGTLLDSVDLHALAWCDAFAKFGHRTAFRKVRSQIGKGGDNLIPVFLSERDRRDHGDELEQWRGKRFKSLYLPKVRPFAAVPALLDRVRGRGLRIGVASSAKHDELQQYLDIAQIRDLVDETASSSDVQDSKPEPDVFLSILHKLNIDGADAVAVGDAPYDSQAAGKAGVRTIGVLSGGFPESLLREAGCSEIYSGPAGLFAEFESCLLAGVI